MNYGIEDDFQHESIVYPGNEKRPTYVKRFSVELAPGFSRRPAKVGTPTGNLPVSREPFPPTRMGKQQFPHTPSRSNPFAE
jgi:hypothetical protein